MPARLPSYYGPAETIRELEGKLYEARWTVIRLMPDDVQDAINEFHHCESYTDLSAWHRRLIQYAIERAEILPERPYSGERAYCPLCGEGTSSPYERGFSIPLGLERHLDHRGRGQSCSVMDIIWAFARDSKKEKLDSEELRQNEEKKAKAKARRNSEILWRVDQDEPKLNDERLRYSDKPRDADSLASAEDRLVRIGFKLSVDGRVTSYSQETEDYIVYGDPRAEGRLEFRVFSKTKKRKKRLGAAYSSFILPDSWRNDLKGKYDSRLADALERL